MPAVVFGERHSRYCAANYPGCCWLTTFRPSTHCHIEYILGQLLAWLGSELSGIAQQILAALDRFRSGCWRKERLDQRLRRSFWLTLWSLRWLSRFRENTVVLQVCSSRAGSLPFDDGLCMSRLV